MEKGIFITDNRLLFSQELASILRDKSFKVCLTGNASETGNGETPNAKYEIEWNRNSIFSLQSIPLQLKNMEMTIDTAVIIFDAPAYLELYPEIGAGSIDNVTAELINANIALTLVLKKYLMKLGKGRIIFVHRELAELCGNVAVAAASGAFIRTAEETVSTILKSENANLQCLLVRLDGKDDASFAEWLYNQLSLPVLSRSPGRWIKAGQRGFFGK